MAIDRIYLDNNATTFCADDVIEVMAKTARMRIANPASQHQFGRDARKCIQQASEILLAEVKAKMDGMNADHVLFCSGGTEANNLAILGLPTDVDGAILVSSIEHPSVLAAAELAQRRGRFIEHIPCLDNGTLDVDWLSQRLMNRDSRVALVAVMGANNETGVIQPYRKVGELCSEANVRFHIDAVQCLGKMEFDFSKSLADSVTLCAHKIHGPVGIGALIHRSGLKLDAQIVGGLQQAAVRSGTESVMLPAGFAQAVLRLQQDTDRLQRIRKLRDRFELRLLNECSSKEFQAHVIGSQCERLPNTSCIAFPPHSRQALQMALDLAGLACSTGSACESGSSTPSHVLLAMGLPEPWIQSAVRFSLSELTTEFEVDEAVSRIVKCLRKKTV